jgi:hypothetical protein
MSVNSLSYLNHILRPPQMSVKRPLDEEDLPLSQLAAIRQVPRQSLYL